MIKTVDQYLESLNDDRQIWCLGEKVADVRTHPPCAVLLKLLVWIMSCPTILIFGICL